MCFRHEMNDCISLFARGMDRFSTFLEITMKLKSEVSGESAARNIADFLTEQQVRDGED